MQFDIDNPINKLCAQGMELEGAGKPEEAKQLFMQAWTEATNNMEKFVAAHYVARQQDTVADKLHWDKTALKYVLMVDDDTMKATYPSLYLNIGKCYEDLQNDVNARKNYELASSHTSYLQDDGYGKMIKSGITAALLRVG